MRFSLKRLLIWVAVLSVVLAGIVFVRKLINVPIDAYRVWNTARALEHYMESHDGAWPTDWDELLRGTGNKTFNSMGGRLSTLRDHVMIDFAFDPAAAAERIREDDANPVFKVIWLKNGSLVHWAGAEPNELIFNYLKARKFDPSRSSSAGIESTNSP